MDCLESFPLLQTQETDLWVFVSLCTVVHKDGCCRETRWPDTAWREALWVSGGCMGQTSHPILGTHVFSNIGRDLERSLVQPPARQSSEQVAQGLVQGGWFHIFSRWTSSSAYCPHREIFFHSCFQCKPLLFHWVTTVSHSSAWHTHKGFICPVTSL